MENFYDVLNWNREDDKDDGNIPDCLKDLCLDNFSANEIEIYPFLIKLGFVLENNSRKSDIEREKRYIDDMMIKLLKIAKYDDGKN